MITQLPKIKPHLLAGIIVCILLIFHSTDAQLLVDDPILFGHIRQALTDNPNISAWRARVEAAEEWIPQAGAWNDPAVTLAWMNVPINTFDLRQEPMTAIWITANQSLPLSDKYTIRGMIAGTSLALADINLLTYQITVAHSVVEAWYDWAYFISTEIAVRENISLLDDILQIVHRRYETGLGSQQDILRVETERTKMESMRLQMEQTAVSTGRKLAVLMGHDPSESPIPPGEVTDIFPSLDNDLLLNQLLSNNPDIQKANADLEISQYRIALARSMWWPDVNVGIGYGFRQESNDGMNRPDFFTLTAGVTLPLLTSQKQTPALRQAQADYRSADFHKRGIELQLRLKLATLLDEDARFEKQIKLHRDGIEPQALAALNASISAYSVGEIDAEALLMAETVLINSRLRTTDLVRNRWKVRASIAALVNEPSLTNPD